MRRICHRSIGRREAALLALLLGAAVSPLHPASLPTVDRQISTYRYGEQTVTCLEIDGGVVPLKVPYGAQLEVNSDVVVVWPEGGSRATFRPASARERELFTEMDKPEAAGDWQKYFESLYDKGASAFVLRDFQPDILQVNGWNMGQISMDFDLGGNKYTAMLLLWRCRDGSTIAVSMQSEAKSFLDQRTDLLAMIGSAMLMHK
jgi:hypothetical protein